MKNPMNKRFLREFKSDLGKYLVIFLFLVMVVSVVSSFLVANDAVARAYHENMDKNLCENGHMSFNLRIDDSTIENIENVADIKLYPYDYFEEINDGATLRVYRLGSEVNLPEVTEGRLPESKGEIALDNLHSANKKIKVGDKIPVDGHELTVTGLVALPNYSALFKDNADLMFDISNFGVGVMSEEGFDDFSSDHVTVSYAWRYNKEIINDKEKEEASEKVLEAIRDELVKVNTDIYQRTLAGEEGLNIIEIKDYLPDYSNKAITFAGEDTSGDGASMEIFLYIVVCVLAFIVAVTTINTISKEASVIGTLRASGYTRAEMVRHYFILPFVTFLLGVFVGNVLGYTLMRDFMLDIYRSMYSFGKAVTMWNKDAFIRTSLIPAIIMTLINVTILIHKLRIRPLAFLRRDISGKKKKKALHLSRKIPFKWRFRIRIILQNLSNYITMMVGIILAGAIIIFGLMFKPLLDDVARRIDNTSISKYQYVLKTPEDISEAGAERFAIETLEMSKEDYKIDEISVYGIEDKSKFIKTIIPDGQVLVSNGFMDKYRVKAGDKIKLYDKYKDKYFEFTVAGDYPYEAALSVFMNLDEFNETFEKEKDNYNGYFSDSELTGLTEANIYMKLDTKAFSGVADQLWKSFEEIMEPMKLFGVIMFVLMVYLLAKQIIEKNQNSISMTKILGFTSGEIGGLYIVSTSIVVILSLLLAVPFVDWLLRLVFTTYLYKRMSGYLPYCVSSSCYIEMVILGIVSYVIVVVLQLFKIKKIKKSDALKNVE